MPFVVSVAKIYRNMSHKNKQVQWNSCGIYYLAKRVLAGDVTLIRLFPRLDGEAAPSRTGLELYR